MKKIILICLIIMDYSYSKIIINEYSSNEKPCKTYKIDNGFCDVQRVKIKYDTKYGRISFTGNFNEKDVVISAYDKNDLWISNGPFPLDIDNSGKDFWFTEIEGRGRDIEQSTIVKLMPKIELNTSIVCFDDYDLYALNDRKNYYLCSNECPANYHESEYDDSFSYGYFNDQAKFCKRNKKCKNNEKYDSSNDVCITLKKDFIWEDPKNSSNFNQICKDTTKLLINDSCVIKTVCDSSARLDITNNDCVFLKIHEKWVSEEDTLNVAVKCEDDYLYINGNCVENQQKYCNNYERYDEISNSCLSLTYNECWLDSNNSFKRIKEDDEKIINGYCYRDKKISITCMDGYFLNENNLCEQYVNNEDTEVEETDPEEIQSVYETNRPITENTEESFINLYQDISLGIGGIDVIDKMDNNTAILILNTNYSIGLRYGIDLLNLKTNVSVGLLYSEFEYYKTFNESEHNYNLSVYFGVPNIGIEIWKLTFDFTYMMYINESIETIKYSTSTYKFTLGFNIFKFLNVNFNMMSSIVNESKVLKSFGNETFLIGVTYRI